MGRFDAPFEAPNVLLPCLASYLAPLISRWGMIISNGTGDGERSDRDARAFDTGILTAMRHSGRRQLFCRLHRGELFKRAS